MSTRYWSDMELMVLCNLKLYRCCGEGPLVCMKERGHDGPHEDEGVVFG